MKYRELNYRVIALTEDTTVENDDKYADRREAPRMTLDVPIGLEGKNICLRDVSLSGLQIECDQALEVGSQTELSLTIPLEYRRLFGERERISLLVEIKWCTPDTDNPNLYRAGGVVTAISEQAKWDLFSYLSLFCGPIGDDNGTVENPKALNGAATKFHEDRINALGQLAGGIAHDFNNHLMIILGRLQMMRMKGAPPELDRHAEKAERAALDAAELVKRLQDFSLNSSPVPLGPVQLNAVMDNAIANARAWAKEHPDIPEDEYSFKTDLERPLVCTGVAADLQKALIYLFKNAMEAMPEGGEIRITTKSEGTDIIVKIEDNGPGLAEEVRGKVFEPFVTTRRGRSRGLGLSIVYGIIRRHGGEIEIKDGPNGGALCRIHLETRTIPKYVNGSTAESRFLERNPQDS
jgi:signal transduction histidine kinase